MRVITRPRRGGAGALAACALAVALTAGCESGGEAGGAGTPESATPTRSASASASTSPPASPSDSGTATATATATATESATPAQPLVEMTVTGGFAGVSNRLLVKDDGSYTTSTKAGPGKPGRMTPDELGTLRRALEKADFDRLPRDARGTPVMDGFTYRITHAGHTVTTDDTAQPPALREVFAALPGD